jgi:hypothetical protein
MIFPFLSHTNMKCPSPAWRVAKHKVVAAFRALNCKHPLPADAPRATDCRHAFFAIDNTVDLTEFVGLSQQLIRSQPHFDNTGSVSYVLTHGTGARA